MHKQKNQPKYYNQPYLKSFLPTFLQKSTVFPEKALQIIHWDCRPAMAKATCSAEIRRTEFGFPKSPRFAGQHFPVLVFYVFDNEITIIFASCDKRIV